MSSKETRMSYRARDRVSQTSPDVDALVSASLGLTSSGSRTEGMFWEGRLARLLDRILDSTQPAPILAALDQLTQQDGTAYGALVEAVEHAAESVRVPSGAQREGSGSGEPAGPRHALLVTAPLVAWTRFSIPSCPLPAEAVTRLTRLWQDLVLAPDVKFQMQPWLYSLDQLPHDFSELRKLTRKLAVCAANGTSSRFDARTMPETAEMLADTRFLLGCVVVPDVHSPVFRWQLGGAGHRSRAQCLDAWVAQSRSLLEPLLPGCGFEGLLPDAYHANLRESDRRVRVWGIKAAVHYLVHSLDIEASAIKAAVSGFGYTRVDEYRIGLSLQDSDEVVQGIVWPLLGPESESDDPSPVDQIRETLQEVGVNDVRVWSGLMEPEFCEDCGSPLYPNRRQELVHVQMPEDAATGPVHFH